MEDIQKAIALKYDKKENGAPKVIGKGKGIIAEQIIAIAKKNKVPVYPDRDLVQVLEALDLDFEIPPDLYRAVAEVLVFIYEMNQKFEETP